MTYKLKLMPAAAVALGLLTGPALAQDKVLTIAGSGGAVKDATEQIFCLPSPKRPAGAPSSSRPKATSCWKSRQC